MKGRAQWRIQGRGPGGPTPPPHTRPHLLLDQTEARKAEKKIFKTAPLLLWSGWPTPPPLIWRSGSATGLYLRSSCKLTEVELCLLRVTFRTLEVFKLHVYGNRQTSDSSWSFLRIEKEQIKHCSNTLLENKKLREATNLWVEIMNSKRQVNEKKLISHVVQIRVCRLT